MRNIGLVLLAAFVAMTQCEACDPPASPTQSCHPCDPVLLLDAEGSGNTSPGPNKAECDEMRSAPTGEIADAWTGRTCWEQVAYYTATTVFDGSDLSDPDVNERWIEQTQGTNVCPSAGTGSGGGCGNSAGDEGGGPPPSIVGPPELNQDVLDPAVAFLVRSSGEQPNPISPIYTELETLVEDALDGQCPAGGVDAQRFEDPAPCTAFLIGEGVVMTALHCYDLPLGWQCPESEPRGPGEPPCRLPMACGGEAPDEMADQLLGFDFGQPTGDWKLGVNLRVEACGNDIEPAHDWMVVSFDPPSEATPRCPLQMPTDPIDLCTTVNMVGHPLGHPQYFTGSTTPFEPTAWVNELVGDGTVETTLDNIPSFSGAPVYDAEDNQLIGMLRDGAFTSNDPQFACGIVECRAEGCDEPARKTSVIDLSTVTVPPNVMLTVPQGC